MAQVRLFGVWQRAVAAGSTAARRRARRRPSRCSGWCRGARCRSAPGCAAQPAAAAQRRQRQAAVLRRRRPRRRTRVEEFANERGNIVPGFRELDPQGCHRQGQRPADPGAAEHRRRLVHAGHRRLARHGRVDEQHVPHQRPAVRQPHGGVRRRRAAGRDAGPGRRARRPAGRPDRVGRRARRRDRRADRRLPQLPVGPRRRPPTSSPPTTIADRRPRVHGQLRPAVRPSRRLRRPGRRSRAPRRRRRPAGPTCPSRSARRRRCACGCSTAGSTSTGSTPTSTTAPTTRRSTTTASCSRPRRTATTAVGDLAEGEWADVAVTIVGAPNFPTDPLNGKKGAFLVRVERLHRRPVPGPPVPHVGDPGDRHVGRTGRASPASPARSRTSSPSGSRRRRPATSPSSRPASSARRPTSSRGSTGPTCTTRSPSTSSNLYQPDLAMVGYPVTDEFQHQFLGLVTPVLPDGSPNPAYDDVQVNGTPDGRVDERDGLHPPGLHGRRRDDAPRPGAARRSRPDDVRVVGPRLRPAVRGDRRQQGARRPRAAVTTADVELPPGDG